jgi:hypothetical protein
MQYIHTKSRRDGDRSGKSKDFQEHGETWIDSPGWVQSGVWSRHDVPLPVNDPPRAFSPVVSEASRHEGVLELFVRPAVAAFWLGLRPARTGGG